MYTVRSFSKAVIHGSKFVYQTVPRLLTIWLDLGENKATAQHETFKKMTDNIAKSIREAPVYKVLATFVFFFHSEVNQTLKWFTAFPQIVSRVGHSNPEVYKYLSQLIVTVMEAYPKQALWLFMSVVKSTKENRQSRGRLILNQLAVGFTPRCTRYPLSCQSVFISEQSA
jgi:serine/threonine-protein kinase ATR